MKLVNVDDIKWQKGVFVNPMTDKPIPVIHKIATIEMLRDWQEEVKAISLDKIKQAREEIENINEVVHDGTNHYYKDCVETKKEVLAILDKLIAESEG